MLIDACAPLAYRRLLDCSASRDPVPGVAGVILAVGRGRRLAPFTDRVPAAVERLNRLRADASDGPFRWYRRRRSETTHRHH